MPDFVFVAPWNTPMFVKVFPGQDLLDLRHNGWVDKRPKKLERAMTLAQARPANYVADLGWKYPETWIKMELHSYRMGPPSYKLFYKPL